MGTDVAQYGQPPSGGCELKLLPAYANAVLLPASRLRAAVS